MISPKQGVRVGSGVRYNRDDFDHSPRIVFYEVTRACDLVCSHCRACAQQVADPNELTPRESRRVIDQLAEFPKPPILVLTGGDPLKRSDIDDLVTHAVRLGLEVALTPSPTPLVTAAALRRLKDCGLSRMAISVDGADAATHDGIRGVPGSFACALRILADARACGISLQVNTSITPENVAQIDAIAELLAHHGIDLWSAFFLVPTGRAENCRRLNDRECEQAFDRLWRQSRIRPYAIKTTEAPHYRRFVLQRRKEDAADGVAASQGRFGSLGLNDGKGILFISHAGLIHPSGFLPIVCGVCPLQHIVQVYQQSPILRGLRSASRLEGKCGLCEYRHVCGGSRARAFAVTGNLFAQEPDCVYLPGGSCRTNGVCDSDAGPPSASELVTS